mgnify:CR=1 FL=1|tara:strand:+ start:18226 stop:18678 length:453 start_codon:yes stop_codon:yes gene_type:complete
MNFDSPPAWLQPCVCYGDLNVREREPLWKFLRKVFGAVGVAEQFKCFTWSEVSMAKEIGVTIVAQALAETMDALPPSSYYLELIERAIGDWQTVDKHFKHDNPEELAQVIETLAKKRDEIRENLREEPYLNAPVGVAQGRFSLYIAEWES